MNNNFRKKINRRKIKTMPVPQTPPKLGSYYDGYEDYWYNHDWYNHDWHGYDHDYWNGYPYPYPCYPYHYYLSSPAPMPPMPPKSSKMPPRPMQMKASNINGIDNGWYDYSNDEIQAAYQQGFQDGWAACMVYCIDMGYMTCEPSTEPGTEPGTEPVPPQSKAEEDSTDKKS